MFYYAEGYHQQYLSKNPQRLLRHRRNRRLVPGGRGGRRRGRVSVATTILLDRLSSLVALFGRGSLDLPDGTLTHDTVFRLNGVAYDSTLGRPVTIRWHGWSGAAPAAIASWSRRCASRCRCAARDRRARADQPRPGCRWREAAVSKDAARHRRAFATTSTRVHLRRHRPLSAIDAGLDPAQWRGSRWARQAEATA
jgi:hypothetical protein